MLTTSGRLCVLTHGSYLGLSDDSLIVRRRSKTIYSTPVDGLGLIFLQGYGMNISVNLQLTLAEKDIPVIFSPSLGKTMAVLSPLITARSELRGQQVLRRGDIDIIRAGLKMLSAKTGNQAAVLRYFAKYRKRTNVEIAAALVCGAQEIRSLGSQILGLNPGEVTVRQIAMGYEGHAAAIYWRNLLKLAPDELGFNGRTTRFASDPVNQCINYVYGMLYGEVWRAVVKAGLDPYFGIIHGSQRDQGSLVFDLIEEFRAPFADRVVFGMIGRGFCPKISKKGFISLQSRHRLAAAFLRFWTRKTSWRSKPRAPSEILEHQAENLAQLFRREKDYMPYRMKW